MKNKLLGIVFLFAFGFGCTPDEFGVFPLENEDAISGIEDSGLGICTNILCDSGRDAGVHETDAPIDSSDQEKFFKNVPDYQIDGLPILTSPDDSNHSGTDHRDCRTCHQDYIGGIIFNLPIYSQTESAVQVVIKTPESNILETYTDSRGRFIFPPSYARLLSLGSKIGIRKGNMMQVMMTPLETTNPPLNCVSGGCHANGDGGQGQIYIGGK